MNLLRKKEAKTEDLEDLDLNEIVLCNSDDEHDPALYNIKLEPEDLPQKKRKTIKLSSSPVKNPKNCSENDLLKYKITLTHENLCQIKGNNTIINFMKNSSDKNVRSIYEELNYMN